MPSRVTGLLSRAAEALGLPVAPVHMDQHARQRTDAHNAVAVMAGGAIMLHPEKFDPRRDDALEIVAHELVHVARLRADAAPGAPRPTKPPSTTEVDTFMADVLCTPLASAVRFASRRDQTASASAALLLARSGGRPRVQGRRRPGPATRAHGVADLIRRSRARVMAPADRRACRARHFDSHSGCHLAVRM